MIPGLLLSACLLAPGPAPALPLPAPDEELRILVAPAGAPAVPGAAVAADLEQGLALALALLREERAGAPPAAVRLELPAGVHELRRTLRLTGAEVPVALTLAGPREGGARLVGGRVQREPELLPVTDPAVLARLPAEAREAVRVVVLDVPPAEGDGWGLAGPVPRGMGRPVLPVGSEVFLDGRPLAPARWPDAGFAPVAEVLDPGSVPRNRAEDVAPEERETGPERGGVFRIDDVGRLERWQRAPALWLHGYWHWDWAEELLPVAAVDARAGTLRLALPHRYGIGPGARFAAVGLLEELDRPGEYAVDPAAGRVYLWPPGGAPCRELLVSLLGGPLLELEGVQHLSLRDLVFEGGRGAGVVGRDVLGVHVERCTFRNLGTTALELEGRGNLVRACLVEDVGATGVALAGGERATLTPAGNELSDSLLRRCGRVFRTYQPAVRLSGVGQRALHLRLTDLPHFALSFEGNEHLVERCEIDHAVQETGDAGAIYCGRDWTLYGTVIRENLFHDIAGTEARYQNAVYLDDMASGIRVSRNVFVRCHWGLLVGGGRDVHVDGNVFVDGAMAVRYDARGVGWMARHIEDPGRSTLHRRLAAVPVHEPPWSRRYPALGRVLEDRFGRPVGGRVEGNELWNTPLGEVDDVACVRVADNVERQGVPAWLEASWPGLGREEQGPSERAARPGGAGLRLVPGRDGSAPPWSGALGPRGPVGAGSAAP